MACQWLETYALSGPMLRAEGGGLGTQHEPGLYLRSFQPRYSIWLKHRDNKSLFVIVQHKDFPLDKLNCRPHTFMLCKQQTERKGQERQEEAMLFMLPRQRPTIFLLSNCLKAVLEMQGWVPRLKDMKNVTVSMTDSHWWGQWTHLKRLQRIQVSTEGFLGCKEFFLWQGTNKGFIVHGCCLISGRKKFRQCWAIAEISQSHSVTRHNDLWKWEKHVSLPSSQIPTKELCSGYCSDKANHS